MKKILLSLIMLCTAVSAWSYETTTVAISCNGMNTSPFTVDATMASDGMDAEPYWEVRNGYNLKLIAPKSCYVTKVEFVTMSGKVEYCDKLTRSQMNVWVSQSSDELQYYDVITFSNPEGSIAKVTSISVTYHRCVGATHHETVQGTCTTKGTAEYWECACGKIYSDAECTNETNVASLATEKDPTNHKVALTKVEAVGATCVSQGSIEHWYCSDCGHRFADEQGKNHIENVATEVNTKNHPGTLEEHARVEATCIKDGNVQYWHCNACNKNFGDAEGKGNEIANVVIPKEQGSHNNLTYVAQKDATCTESGYTMNHWRCSDCGKNFADEACTTQITDEVVIPAINHKNKTFKEYLAPTTEAEGNVAHWYCPDCDKHFGDAECKNELTEWQLAKLVNMMHLCFDGTSVPVETEHYISTAKFNFTDGGDVILTVNDKSVTYDKGMIDKVKFSNGTPTVTISANEDPGKGIYYSTFYSYLESYSVPEGFTAYRGEISDDGTKLSLTSVEVMSRGKGYILKGPANSGSMSVTENPDGDDSYNVLLGTDVAIDALGASDYALSLGQNGVGFYLWNGKAIGANKAYLTLSSDAKALTFEFDVPTGIEESLTPTLSEGEGAMYNLNGMMVGKKYKGIVIKNGKKYLKK